MGILATKLSTATSVSAGGLVPVGVVEHNDCMKLSASGNTWRIDGRGYHSIISTITIAPVTAGEVVVTMYDNGQAITSATATTGANAEAVTLPLLVLDFNKCRCSTDSITIGSSVDAVVSELDVLIEGGK